MPKQAAHYALTFLVTAAIAFFYLVVTSHHTIINPLASKAVTQSVETADEEHSATSAAMVKKLIKITSTPTPTATPIPTATPTPSPTPVPTIATSADLETLFDKYSSQYTVDKELLKRIAACESGFNTNADNGTNTGLFQYGQNSWISTRTHMGADTNPDLRKNAEEAIKTAAFQIATFGAAAWPSCK